MLVLLLLLISRLINRSGLRISRGLKFSAQFNESKCKVGHIGKNNSRNEYLMNGVVLEVSDKEKDIGVII